MSEINVDRKEAFFTYYHNKRDQEWDRIMDGFDLKIINIKESYSARGLGRSSSLVDEILRSRIYLLKSKLAKDEEAIKTAAEHFLGEFDEKLIEKLERERVNFVIDEFNNIEKETKKDCSLILNESDFPRFKKQIDNLRNEFLSKIKRDILLIYDEVNMSTKKNIKTIKHLTVKSDEKIVEGRYIIIEEIGRGANGITYKAKQISLDKIVALKMIIPEKLLGENSEHIKKRFKKEINVQSILDHPNIIKILDANIGESADYYVMEYAGGGSLKNLILERRLTIKKSIGIILDICNALKYIHDEKYIHRDIKPDNILFNSVDGRPILSDFGLCRKQIRDTTRISGTGEIIGTEAYMSPEQLRGEDDLKCNTDIFSLGITFHEMLVGRLPRFRKPSQINPEINSGLDDIILKMTEDSNEQRYQNIIQLKEDIIKIEKLYKGKQIFKVLSGIDYDKFLDDNGKPTIKAVIPWIHVRWKRCNIEGAKWVWKREKVTPEEAKNGCNTTLFRNIPLPIFDRIINAKIRFHVDDFAKVTINNQTINGEYGGNLEQICEIEIGKFIKPNDKDLEIKIDIRNIPSSSNPESNPTGIIYEMVIEYE